MIPYPSALTTTVDPEENHPLANWNNPTLTRLWTLAEASPQTLTEDSALALDALQLTAPTSYSEAQETLTLIKQGLEALLQKIDRDGVHIDDLLDTVDVTDITSTVDVLLTSDDDEQSEASKRLCLLDYLDGAQLQRTSITEVRAYPLTSLVRVLTTPSAKALAVQLRQALGWMDGDGSQAPSPVMDFKLLVAAARIDMDPAGNLAGFDLNTSDLIGLGYEDIRHRFQERLVQNESVRSAQMAIVACMALQANFSSDFGVLGIPADLPYRSSTRWVQFRHGVELAEAIQPGTARTMTYQELVRFPMQVGLDASPEQREIITVALVQPAILWAKADTTLAPTLPVELDAEAVERILLAYVEQDTLLQNALEHACAPIPKRFEIAEQLLKQRGISPKTLYINRPAPALNTPINMELYPRSRQVPALQVIASCSWQPTTTTGDEPTSAPLIDVPSLPAFIVLDKPEHWHPVPALGNGGEYFRSWSPGFVAPSALEVFNTRFAPWLSKMRAGYLLIIRRLLSELPAYDQRALTGGDVGVFTLRNIPDPNDIKGDGGASDTARFGFVIQTTWQAKTRTYEVLPNTLQIIKRLDVPRLGLHHYPTGSWIKDRFDFASYATGSPPSPEPTGTVGLVLAFGFVAANHPYLRDPRVDLGTVPQDQRLETLAMRASASLIYGTDELVTAYARGRSQHDRYLASKDVSQFFKDWIVPFWGAIEDVIEGVKTGDPLKVFLGVLGIAFDIVAILVPGSKALTQTARIALLTTTRTLRQSLIQTVKVGAKFLLKSGRDLIPVLSLIDLGRVVARGTLGVARSVTRLALVDGAAKAALNSLRSKIKSTPRRLRLLFTPPEQMIRTWQVANPALLQTSGFIQRQVGPQQGVLVYSDRLGRRPSSYLVDPATGHPYGPPLVRLDDTGSLGLRHRAATIRLTPEGGALSFFDPTPDLSKRWMIWNGDLYLDMDGVHYKYLVLAEDNHVLRRTNSPELKPFNKLDFLPCRKKRSMDPVPCAPGTYRSVHFVDQAAKTAAGSGAVPWFNNRKIVVDSNNCLIDNEAKWAARGNGTLVRSGKKKYPPEAALPQIKAEIIAGNDLFKQVTITGGIFKDIADTRIVSGVVARHKDSARKVLVVRADDNLYYRADYTPGEIPLQMDRLTLNPNLVEEAATEDDFLALIHNGSGEAHRVIASLSPRQLADDLRLIQADLATRADFPVAQAIGGPFDMGTTPAEAALFCKYTQSRLISHAKDTARYRFPLVADTPLEVRERIATDLNALYRDQLFDADTIYSRAALREGTNPRKNLAYVHVRFNSSSHPDRLYYSWSGSKSQTRVPLAELELDLRQGKASAPDGWQLVAEGLQYDNVVYINAQPKKIPVANSVLFLPDIQHQSFRTREQTNTRLLDSERNIVTRIKADSLDNDTIASVDAFTVRPTCQSCTIGLDGLKTEMTGVDFNLYEGPA
jgi:hypothetical protein